MTVKLYDKDAYIKEFSATVLSCKEEKNGFSVTLDQTAFFPEAGGQPSDTGSINGVAVKYVSIENGVIFHLCESALSVGDQVLCKIDFARRFSFMQNHSGEHIVSGVVFRKYGFDNVGFHLNEQFATLDFNGILSREQLDEIEDEANKTVFENRKIRCFYPTKEELENIEYRSKKELSDDIRIVDIEGADVCACCAPHVDKTGEIGIIKLLDTEKMRGGTRIVLKCGKYALFDYRDKYKNIYAASNLLSCKQEQVACATEKLLAQLSSEEQKFSALRAKYIECIINANKGENRLVFADDFDVKSLQLLTDGLHKTYGGVFAAMSGADDNYSFCICGNELNVNSVFAKFKNEFSVRGGGRNGMVQGSVCAEKTELIKFFQNITEENHA